MRKEITTEIISALFILLFVYAAVSKLADYDRFTMQLSQSPILNSYAGWAAWMVPVLELIIAALLFSRRSRLVGLYFSFSLMATFTFYIISITRFSEFIPCSCGGILSKMGWNQHLVFNVVFVLLSTVAVLLYDNKKTNNKLSAG